MSSCSICLEPELNVPAACIPCGHTFCYACITQWTRSPPRFGVSLCPQCRGPVREVQKLFISDWPASSGSGGLTTPSQLSPWQQFTQLVTLFVHFLSIPFHTLAQYGPEMGRRFTVWLNQQAERLVMLRTQLTRRAVMCLRDWQDLGRPAQCLVAAGILLVALLLVQDLQDQDGIHRGIVLPILLVIADIVRLLFTAATFVLYRPLSCLATCGLEVALAAADVSYVLATVLLWVTYDAICIPWMLACVAARVLCALLSGVASLLRVGLLCVLVASAVGVPRRLATPNQQPLRAQLTDLLQAALEWLRQQLAQHPQQGAQHGRRPRQQAEQRGQRPLEQRQQAEQRGQWPQEQRQQAEQQELRAPRVRRHRSILRDFLRRLSEDLRSGGGDREEREAAFAGEGAGGRREEEGGPEGAGRGEEGGRQDDGEWEDARWGQVEEEDGEAWQNEVNPESFLHDGDTLEVW